MQDVTITAALAVRRAFYDEQIKRTAPLSAALSISLTVLPDKEDIPCPPGGMAVCVVVNFRAEPELASELVRTPRCLIVQRNLLHSQFVQRV